MYEGLQRKTGGQPGNQNARKHGFYSKVLDHDEKYALRSAAGLDGLDQEIAVLRLKFRSLLSQDGQNVRLINQTADTLAKLYHIKNSYCRNDSAKLREAFSSVLNEFVIPQPVEPDHQP
jgi:hypothetical protein